MRVRTLCILLFTVISLVFGAATPNRRADIVETSRGPLKITPLFHGSVMLAFDGKVIHIDPWSQAELHWHSKSRPHRHHAHARRSYGCGAAQDTAQRVHYPGGAAGGHRYAERDRR